MNQKVNNNIWCCELCNKIYSSKSSLCNHNKKFHNNIIKSENISVHSSEKIYSCNYCGKNFKLRQYKYSHQKICKTGKAIVIQNQLIIDKENEKFEIKKIKEENKLVKQNNIRLKEESKLLKLTIFKNKSIIINNTVNSNSNVNINNITINAFGSESVNKLNIEDIINLANQNKNAIIYIVDLLNFNEKYPENHNFCTTSLDGNYVSVLNKNTNKIEKINKSDFFDNVLVNSIQKISDVLFITDIHEDKKIENKHIKKLEDSINPTTVYNNKHKKIYKQNINQLSYNKKDLILNTWKSNIKENSEIDIDSDTEYYSDIDKINSDDDIDYIFEPKI